MYFAICVCDLYLNHIDLSTKQKTVQYHYTIPDICVANDGGIIESISNVNLVVVKDVACHDIQCSTGTVYAYCYRKLSVS